MVGGIVVVGGMVSEGRLCCRPSRLLCWCPQSRLLGGLVEWRVWCVL